MEGWIKLYRKFCEWEWFNISEMVHLYIHLLLNANQKDGEWRGILIKRGQILTGLNSLNEKTGISIQTLRTCLLRLESTNEITSKVTNKYRIITIIRYDDYQNINGVTNKLNNKQNNKQLTSNQQSTNNKQEYKEEKEYKKYSDVPPKIGDVKIRFEERKLTGFTVENWFAHYEANGWKVGKNKMVNWDAALTTWSKNNLSKNENNSGNNRRSVKRANDLWN